MITGLMHHGSGLGNQLHRYIATRVRAKELGCDFGMVAPQNFKGASFMDVDLGKHVNVPYVVEYPSGRVVPTRHDVWEEGTNYYNPEFNFIEEDTLIDGEFQDERYFEEHLDDVDGWLKVAPLDMPEDLCVINFRGGEYAVFPELFLTEEYWWDAISIMRHENPEMRFEVHTDDKELARKFFPDFDVIQNMGLNWRSLRYAKNAIIANSSFAILPRLLADTKTIAPRYWARRNVGEWSMPQNYYKSFLYI